MFEQPESGETNLHLELHDYQFNEVNIDSPHL